MSYWIGVIGSKVSYTRFTSEENWFCMPSKCEVGDSVLMYASKSAAGVKSGIFGQFTIDSRDPCKDDLCKNYGAHSGTGERPSYFLLKPEKLYATPISFQALKKNQEVGRATFVNRNMQATYFPLSKRQFDAIVGLGNFSL